MHSSALLNLEKFFDIYLKKFENPTIIDFGGRAINDHKSAKDILKKYNIKYKYICVDIENGEGVDLCIKDSYNITEIENNSADIIISTSTFEHIELFWLSYLEIIKILKPKGLFYFNAPSNGDFHRYHNYEPAQCQICLSARSIPPEHRRHG